MQVTQTDIIKAQIEYGAQGISNKEITKNILNEWRGSDTIRDMVDAELYSRVKNTTIETKSRSYKDDAGNIIPNDSLSNVKTKTAQYRKRLIQKVNFTLSKPFVISCNDDKYKEQWELFLNEEVRNIIQRTGKQAINKGIGYIYPYIKDGKLTILDIAPETIYPAWKDESHTELDAIVRDYTVIEYTNLTPQNVRKVEFWDNNIVEKYIDYSMGEGGNGDLTADVEENLFDFGTGGNQEVIVQKTHLQKSNGEGLSWERVPFVFLKGNDDELPLLNECREDIDCYDMLKSKAIDSLIDDIDPTLVIEDIGAEMGELAKARKMVQNSRIMSVEKGGKAYFVKVDTSINSISQALEMIKKDIQDNTNTVDLTTIQFGNNPSAKAMRTCYANLEEWANGFENEFRNMMKNLKYFFDKWLSWKEDFGTFEELQQIPISFTLDRDMIIDETDIFDNLVKMKDELSQETKDEINPWVESHQKEQKRREEDSKRLQEEMELYNFGNNLEEIDKKDNLDKLKENLQK